MSASRSGYVICPRCSLPNPIGPSACWKCGTALPTTGPLVRSAATAFSSWGAGDQVAGGAGSAAYPGSAAGGPSGSGPSSYGRRPRRIRWAPFIAGAVLLGLGAVMIVGSIVLNAAPTSASVPANSSVSLDVTSLTNVKATISWSGGNASTQIWLISGIATCSGPTGVVKEENGSSGTFSATLTAGTTYSLYACDSATGAGEIGDFSYTLSGGFSALELLGIFLVIIGAPVLYSGTRRRRFVA